MEPLAIVSRALPPAMATLAFDFDLQAIGGTPPYVWSVVPGFGNLDFGVNLVGASLIGAAGAIPNTAVGVHTFRIKAIDSSLSTVTADVSISVKPYGFTRAHEFLLDPQVFDLIQKYLVGGATREKTELHFFRDLPVPFVHLDRDIEVPAWTGIFPYVPAFDTDLRGVLDGFANDLMYFADPVKYEITSVVPGPGAHQATFILTPPHGIFIGRNGETDAAMARKWFRLVDPDSEDEPHDGDGNPLTITWLYDSLGVEVDPNARPYQSDVDGFHTGRDGGGASIGYNLTLIVEYVPNPHARDPILPFCVRYGVREELHDVSPEAFIKFGNVLGEVDASIIALIKNAAFVGNIRVGNQVVKPIQQTVEFQGQNGLDIEADVGGGLIRFVAPDSIRTLNGVSPAGSGDFELAEGEFIEVESEVAENRLTIKTVIPVHVHQDPASIFDKALISKEDYGKFLQLIGSKIIRMHKHRGEDLNMGLPTDGSWSDGYIPLSDSATLADTMDRLNEALFVSLGASVVPLGPDVGFKEISGVLRDTAFLANDALAIVPIVWEFPAYPPGSEAPYVYNDWNNRKPIPVPGTPYVIETTMEFGPVAAPDTLTVFVNGIALEAWTPLVLVPLAVSPLGYMQIMTVRAIGLATVITVELRLNPKAAPVLALLVKGYNRFQLGHNALLSGEFKVFIDSYNRASGTGMPASANIFSDAPGKHAYLSGIDHYAGDNELLVTTQFPCLFDITYYNPILGTMVDSALDGVVKPEKSIPLSDTHLSGVSFPFPDYSDIVNLTDFPTGCPVKGCSNPAWLVTPRVRIISHRPGGDATKYAALPLHTALNETVLYTLGEGRTTDKAEYFEDEKYRLNPRDPHWGFDYAYFPVMVRETFGWKSDRTLDAGTAPFGDGSGVPGDLQVNPRISHSMPVTGHDDGALVWPQINYNIGLYKPNQPAGRDYGVKFAATTVCTFDRPIIFKDTPRNHGTLKIVGITSADIGNSYLGGGGVPTGNVNIEIKFPGHRTNFFSGWMDLSKLALGTFNDGDGCRVGAMRDFFPGGADDNYLEIDWTGNGLSTEDSGEMIIVRITYRNSGVIAFRLEEIGA